MIKSELTVVVPVHNRANIVTTTLDSVALQLNDIESLNLIIVDNNSTDDTLATIERWADAHRSNLFHIDIAVEHKPGAAAARNLGLDMAYTSYVMFFDSDDIMPPELIKHILNAFHTPFKPDIVAWGVDYYMPDHSIKHISPIDQNRHLYFNAIVHGKLSTQRYAARRDLFVRAGGWNDSVRVWDDMELSVRLLIQNPKIKSIALPEKPRVIFTQSSITASIHHIDSYQRCEHALDMCERALRDSNNEKIIKWIDYRRTILAADYARAGNHQAALKLLSDVRSLNTLIKRLIFLKHRVWSKGSYLLMPFARH